MAKRNFKLLFVLETICIVLVLSGDFRVIFLGWKQNSLVFKMPLCSENGRRSGKLVRSGFSIKVTLKVLYVHHIKQQKHLSLWIPTKCVHLKFERKTWNSGSKMIYWTRSPVGHKTSTETITTTKKWWKFNLP